MSSKVRSMFTISVLYVFAAVISLIRQEIVNAAICIGLALLMIGIRLLINASERRNDKGLFTGQVINAQ